MPSSGGAVLKNMGRTFLAAGGTKLPGSQVYGRNVDPRLLRAYLPKEKRWHEPRDKKVDDDEVDTKKAPAKDDGVQKELFKDDVASSQILETLDLDIFTRHS